MSGNDGNGEGFVEELDESGEILEADVRVLVDEEGNEMPCALLAVVEHEGQDYALLTPLEQLSEEAGEIELFILEYSVNEEGDETFSTVDDDERYEAVKEFCTTLIAEEAEDDEAGD